MLIDRGACQAMAIHGYEPWGVPPTEVGSAEYCFKAVFLNLAFTDALIVWLEWIFLCLPIARWDKADRAATTAKFKTIALLGIIYIIMVFFLNTPEWLIQTILGAWAFFVKMHTFRMYIAEMLHGNNAIAQNASRYEQATQLFKKALLGIYMIEEPDPLEDDVEPEGAVNGHAHAD